MVFSNLSRTAIFRNMTEEEIRRALNCLHAEEKHYRKHDYIFTAGDSVSKMGMVLSGSVIIESNDYWGKRTIIQRIGEGQYFAETFAWMPKSILSVDISANEDCSILFLSISQLRDEDNCSAGCVHKVLVNLLNIFSSKNMALSARNLQTSPKTIRERLIIYLNTVRLQKGAHEFDIPFSRQQLADYLNLERTALSKELSKMQADELISYHKNHFILHKIRDDVIIENESL